MVVAEAMTIHKSQGSTLGDVVVHLTKGMEMSLTYVAFTRSTLLTSLYIIGDFKKPKPLKDDHAPTKEMKRLRETSALVPKFAFLREVPSDVFQVISHNVQSIRNHHIKSIRNDRVFMSSSLLLLQETWATVDETFSIEGMVEVARNLIKGQPTARGTMIYAKSDHPTYAMETYSFEERNNRIDITTCEANNVVFVNIYKNPSTSAQFFEDSLMDFHEIFYADNLILCGDFNDRQVTEETRKLHRFLTSTLHLQLMSPKDASTTNNFTKIDAVFGKLKDYKAEVHTYESFFSYHKPLVIRLKKLHPNE
jgi:exonuclease III